MKQVFTYILDNWKLFSVVGGLLLLLLIFIFVVYLLNKRDAKTYKNTLDNITNPRIYILDFGENMVTYFNRGQYSNIKHGLLPSFYDHFTASEREGLEKWIHSVLDKNIKSETFYYVDVFVSSLRRSYASILEVTKVDYDKKIIHLESCLYRYLKPKSQINFKVKNKENIGYMSEAKMSKLFLKANKQRRGYVGVINIMSQSTKSNPINVVNPLVWHELQNAVTFFRSKKRFIILNRENYTVGLYLPKAENVKDINQILDQIVYRMHSYLEVNDFTKFSLGRGIAFGPQFKDLKMCINTAEELSVFAHREKSKTLIHNPNQEVKDLDLSVYRNELVSVVAKKAVDPLFQPIVSSHSVEVLGYSVSFLLESSVFTSYQELETFAKENKKSEALVKMVLRKTAARYYNSRRNEKEALFIPLMIEQATYLDDIFDAQAYARNIQIVFWLEEIDFINTFDNIEDMRAVINKIKNLHHQVALVISDTELILPDEILGEMDYFIVNDKTLTHVMELERERLYLLTSLGKLLRYKKPILMTEIKSWSDIEYYIRAGIDYVSSDEISKKNSQLQSIDKKKALRIINFSKRR